jgi:hypothetical protein
VNHVLVIETDQDETPIEWALVTEKRFRHVLEEGVEVVTLAPGESKRCTLPSGQPVLVRRTA